jgi:hypothetical protein
MGTMLCDVEFRRCHLGVSFGRVALGGSKNHLGDIDLRHTLQSVQPRQRQPLVLAPHDIAKRACNDSQT